MIYKVISYNLASFQRSVGHRDRAAGDHLRRPHRGRHVALPLPRPEDLCIWSLRCFCKGNPSLNLWLRPNQYFVLAVGHSWWPLHTNLYWPWEWYKLNCGKYTLHLDTWNLFNFPPSFSLMDMLLQLEVMTPLVGCSTSGPTRSSVSTAMITSSVGSLVLHSVNPVVFYLLATMTLTAMSGTHSELNEQVMSFLRLYLLQRKNNDKKT